jgi:hypothetical protein
MKLLSNKNFNNEELTKKCYLSGRANLQESLEEEEGW